MNENKSESLSYIDQIRPLEQDYFFRDSVELAPDLLGKVIVTKREGVLTAGLITETEAYPSWDAASHLFGKDKPTPRTEIQYAGGGALYMYLIMGLHNMTSIVAGEAGKADVVFIRSVMPLIGIDEMRRRRSYSKQSLRGLTSGPGKLSSALGLSLDDNGVEVFNPTSQVKLVQLPDLERPVVKKGKRINVGVHGSSADDANLAIERDWRFFISGSEFLSVPEREP